MVVIMFCTRSKDSVLYSILDISCCVFLYRFPLKTIQSFAFSGFTQDPRTRLVRLFLLTNFELISKRLFRDFFNSNLKFSRSFFYCRSFDYSVVVFFKA